MKIVFVNSFDLGPNNIPIGILSLATILKSNGYDVEVCDFNNETQHEESEDIYISRIVNSILGTKPDVICFYTMCNSYHKTVIISKRIKEIDIKIKIVFGGPHASLTASDSIEAFPWVDVICVGEGEDTIEDLIKSIYYNVGFEQVKGAVYRMNENIVTNKEPNLITDLDKLPFIDYELVDISKVKVFPIDIGRGCPFSCTYCSTKTFWKRKFRLKSNKRIIEEIKLIKEKYKIKTFEFIHDLLTFDKKRIMELCYLICEEEINIKWGCSARIDTLDEDIIKSLVKAGCDTIYIGIETGSRRMQKMIKKNLDLSNIWGIVDILNKYNMKTTLSFIYGFPNETFEDLKATVNMVKKAKEKGIHQVQLHMLGVLPSTEVFYNTREQLEFTKNYTDISFLPNIDFYKDILRNVNIFPQYYSFNSSIREEYKYLSFFVVHIVHLFNLHFLKTYKLLLHEYDDDLLNFFIDFNMKSNGDLEEIFDKNYDLSNEKNLLRQIIKIITKFIENNTFKNNLLIKEVFKFEVDVIAFLLKKDIDCLINDYKIDIRQVDDSNLYNTNNIIKPCKIKFVKEGNNSISLVEVAG